MARKLKNRLLFLLTERERKLGKRIPQSEVARVVGVSNNTITNWIHNNVTKYEAPIVERLCDYFDCDLGDLLYFETIEDDSTS